MAKKKAKAANLPEEPVTDVIDPFIGGEEDDLMDMEYVQDETTQSHDTHPPETEEEAALRATEEVDDPTPPKAEEEEEEDDGVQAEEEAPESAEAEEEVLETKSEDPRIPKERFDEVNERMKRAEEKLKRLEAEQKLLEATAPEPESEPYDYNTKDQEAMDALLEGDAKRYSEIQDEIRQAAKDEAIREAKKLAAEGDSQVRETLTFEETATRIEQEYPQFSEGTDKFDQAAYDDLMDLYADFAQSGRYNRVDALRKASQMAAKLHGLDHSSTPEAATPTPDNVVNIKKSDVAAKAKLAERQPPKMEGGAVSAQEPTHDLGSMSDEQFEALPESTKRRLRGDIL